MALAVEAALAVAIAARANKMWRLMWFMRMSIRFRVALRSCQVMRYNKNGRPLARTATTGEATRPVRFSFAAGPHRPLCFTYSLFHKGRGFCVQLFVISCS